jgi:hypothetical protein
MSAPLCGPCSAESARWLDTSPATLLPRLSLAYGSGAVYDASPAGLRERRAARHAEWVATVRRQRQLVADGCRAGRHAVTPTPAPLEPRPPG